MYIMTTIECLTLHLTVLVSGNCGSLYALFSICCSFLNDKNDFICIYAQPYCRVYLSTNPLIPSTKHSLLTHL